MYPQYPRHWLTASEALQLKEFFYLVSCEITSRLDHNIHADERGLTDELVRILTDNKNPLITELRQRLNQSKAAINLTLRETSIKDEALIGADFGILVRIATDDIQYETSALFQAKRLQPHGEKFTPFCSYGLEESRSRLQSSKMLDHNSAAFFILYNPTLLSAFSNYTKSVDLQQVIARQLFHWDKYREETQRSLGKTLPQFTVSDGFNKIFEIPFNPYDGICILPAAFIHHVRPSSLRAKQLHRYTMSFADFMVDDFIQGKIGDSTKRGIDTVRGKNRMFEIRYSLGLEVRSGRFFTGDELSPLFL